MEERQSRLSNMDWKRFRPYLCVRLIPQNSMFSNFCHLLNTIRQINISPELQTWMPNTGEMVYSDKHNRLAFAYKLHPVIEIFDTDGKTIKSVKIGEDTFDPKTLEEADFEAMNSLHTVDVTCTSNYIYALHWGYGYSDADKYAPTIYKIDWNGKVFDRYFNVPYPLYRIAALDDTRLIGWNGKEFVGQAEMAVHGF